MKILTFNGSPRKKGNCSILLQELLRGAGDAGAECEEIWAQDLDLKYCRGCLRCNLLKKCSIRGDDWENLSSKILAADALVFASPVYFHHVSAPLKKILDRFRSFVHVQIRENGLVHTPWHTWKKDFVLLMPMGASQSAEAQPAVDLFTFITGILGDENRLHTVLGTRLAANRQVSMDREELGNLYEKLQLPGNLVEKDYYKNQEIIKICYECGKNLAMQNK